VPKHKLLVMDMCFKATKVGIGSSSQELKPYGSLRKKRHERSTDALSEIR